MVGYIVLDQTHFGNNTFSMCDVITDSEGILLNLGATSFLFLVKSMYKENTVEYFKKATFQVISQAIYMANSSYKK